MADNNEPLETADTAPSRARVVGLAIIMYAVVACAGYLFIYQPGQGVREGAIALEEQERNRIVSGIVPAYSPAAYLAPETQPLLLPEQIAYANLQIAVDTTSLATLLGNNPAIRLIFVDPRMLADLDSSWLGRQYEQGKIIVGLNTTHSELAGALGLEANEADISAEESRNSVISASVFYVQDGEPQEISAAYSQFNQMLAQVNGIAAQSP